MEKEPEEGFPDAAVEGGMEDSSIAAVTRVLRKGRLDTRPEEDAAKIAKVLRAYPYVGSKRMREVAAEIRDFTRAPSTPLGHQFFRIWGDMGADVCDRIAELMEEEEQ